MINNRTTITSYIISCFIIFIIGFAVGYNSDCNRCDSYNTIGEVTDTTYTPANSDSAFSQIEIDPVSDIVINESQDDEITAKDGEDGVVVSIDNVVAYDIMGSYTIDEADTVLERYNLNELNSSYFYIEDNFKGLGTYSADVFLVSDSDNILSTAIVDAAFDPEPVPTIIRTVTVEEEAPWYKRGAFTHLAVGIGTAVTMIAIAKYMR